MRYTYDSGEPATVRFTHEGRQYVVRLHTVVKAIRPTGAVGPDGLPVFNLDFEHLMRVECGDMREDAPVLSLVLPS